MPELLQRLPAGPARGPVEALEAPTREGLDALLRRTRRSAPRSRRRTRILAGAAAAIIALLVAGSVVWSRSAAVQQASPRPTQQTVQPSGSAPAGTVVQFVAAAGSALSGRATLTPRQWGCRWPWR